MAQWYVQNKKADFAAWAKTYGIDPVTARIIRNREIKEGEELRLFLKGTREDLYDPALLYGAEDLVAILREKIKEQKRIRIIGDYDIDGVMSSYILVQALSRVGALVDVQIPHRIEDGYGLNGKLVEDAYEAGIDTILTCDNGIAAIEEIARAKELGMTVLVTDHHEIPYEMEGEEKRYIRSQADAIVNPHQRECTYPFKDLCGAVVAWKVMQLLYRRLGRDERELDAYLENAAFATVGDIMDLRGENRILVQEGLKRIHHTTNLGMRALIAHCGLEPSRIESYHFGYVLGPCVNASGRLDTAKRALELFLEEDPAKASVIAEELVALNEERKSMTAEGTRLALERAKEYQGDKVLVIYLPEVHESIAGIIAGRVREACYKPVFILTDTENGVKGSGRSIEEYSMFEEMNQAADLMTKFGGHPMAAGLSLPRENVEAFRKRLNEACKLTEQDLEEKVHIDVPMPMSYASEALVEELERLAPFGKGNPRPLFAEKNLKVYSLRLVGKESNVAQLTLRTSDGHLVKAVCFRNAAGFLDYLADRFGEEELAAAKRGDANAIELAVVYTARLDHYRDNTTLKFEIQYYK